MFKFQNLIEYFGKNPLTLSLKDKYIEHIVQSLEKKQISQFDKHTAYLTAKRHVLLTNNSDLNTLKKRISDFNVAIDKYNETAQTKAKTIRVKIFYDNKVPLGTYIIIIDNPVPPNISNYSDYLLRNFRYNAYQFDGCIDLEIGEKSAEYVLKQFNITDRKISTIKVDKLLGETDALFHFGYKDKHFFTYKEDTDHPIRKMWNSIDLNEDYLNSLNKSDIWIKENRKFYAHQVEGIKFLLWVKKGFIFDKTGIGKSNQALAASLLNGGKKTLIFTIKEDVKKWADLVTDFGKTSETISATYTKTETLANVDYHIINYDIIKKFSKSENTNFNIFSTKYDTIIIDECHKIRNYQAIKSDILNKLFNTPSIKYIYGLSATPFESNEQLLGLYQTLNIDSNDFIPCNKDGYSQKFEKGNNFKINYCSGFFMKIKKKMKGNETKDIEIINTQGDSNTKELAQRIKYTYLCRSSDEVEGFPEKIVNVLNLELDLETRRRYDEYYKELIVTYTQDNEDGSNINPELPATTKLRQFLAEYATAHTDVFVRRLIEGNDEKVIIFTHFNDEFKILCERMSDIAVWVNANPALRWNKKSNNAIVEHFKTNPDVKVLIGNAMTLGTAHNIPEASHSVLNSPNWNSGEHDQMMGRNWRLGKKGTVNAWFWVFEDTKSEHIFNRAEEKGGNIKILLTNIYK